MHNAASKGQTPDQKRERIEALAAENAKLREEVARLQEKIIGMDVVGLAYEQRLAPGPFDNPNAIGTTNAYMRDAIDSYHSKD